MMRLLGYFALVFGVLFVLSQVPVVGALFRIPFLGFMALVQALNGVFRGAGNTRHAMTISLVMQYAFQIPFAWGITRFTGLGALGVWWSYAFASIVTSAIVVWWLRRGQWRRELVS